MAMLTSVATALGTLVAILSILTYFGWSKERLFDFFRLLLGGRIEYLLLPEAQAQSMFAEERIYLPHNSYGLQYIEVKQGSAGVELKEGSESLIQLKPYTTRLIVAGWGLLINRTHLGSILDSGDIGRLTFLDRKMREISHLRIALPGTLLVEDCLRLGDADPVFSGSFPEALAKASGLLAVAKAKCIPKRTPSWAYANVWIDDVQVPKNSHHAEFAAVDGSIHIVTALAIRSLRRKQEDGKRQEECEEARAVDYAKLARSLEEEARTLQGEEFARRLGDAAYLYANGPKRQSLLREAGQELVDMARQELASVSASMNDRNGTKASSEQRMSVCLGASVCGGLAWKATMLDVGRLLNDGHAYLYQAEGLTRGITEEIAGYLTELGDHFAKLTPPSLVDAFYFWTLAGGVSLEYAHQAESRGEVVHFVNGCYDLWIERIVEAIENLPSPSPRHIGRAIELCLVLRRWFHKLAIAGPRLERLNKTQDHFEKMRSDLQCYSSVGTL